LNTTTDLLLAINLLDKAGFDIDVSNVVKNSKIKNLREIKIYLQGGS